MIDEKNTSALKFDKQRYRVKYCPCGKSNRDGKFVPYVGYDDKGYCHSCAETFLPAYSKNKNGSNYNETGTESTNYFLPIRYKDYAETFRYADGNNLIIFVNDLFGEIIANDLITKYNIGTSIEGYNGTIFWQHDINGRLRTGKIIDYLIVPNEKSIISKDCKRNKEKNPPVGWVHNEHTYKNFTLKQCLYGEDLLSTEPNKPIAIVESEKTAIIASVYLPQFLWLACGSLSGLSYERCKVLRNKNVTLFPDLNGYAKWSKKAQELWNITNFKVSGLLEKIATEEERQQGLDLADYLIRFNHKQFTQ